MAAEVQVNALMQLLVIQKEDIADCFKSKRDTLG